MNGTCESVREDLPLLAADALADARAQQIAAHLSSCADCRREHDLIALLRAQPLMPPGLEARVRRAVAVAPPRRTVRPALAAAAAAVIIAGGAVAVQWAGDNVAPVATDTMTDLESADQLESAELGWAARTDPLLHDEPGLAALSDEELEVLLQEMQS